MSTMADLRESLFDTIKQLKAGTIKSEQAASICNVAGRLLQSAEIELKLRQLTGDFHSGGGFLIDVSPVEIKGAVLPPTDKPAARRMDGIWPIPKPGGKA